MENKCDNKRDCPCTYDCPRHGKCCACMAHHRDHNEGVPGCFFSKEEEATYDRSIGQRSWNHQIGNYKEWDIKEENRPNKSSR